MSLLLVIDAATPQSVVAVGVPGDAAPLVHGEELARGNQASEALVDRIREAVARAGARVPDVTALAVGRGPGTFTGARVAVATAKGLALGLALDLHPFSTLEAIAHDPLAGTPGPGDVPGHVPGHVLATLDARKGEVYGAWYAVDPTTRALERVGDERVAALSRFLEASPAGAPSRALLAGSGLRTDPAALDGVSPSMLHELPGTTAAGAWAAANAALRRPAVPTAALDVTYLRRSYAELGIHPPRRVYPPSPFV